MRQSDRMQNIMSAIYLDYFLYNPTVKTCFGCPWDVTLCFDLEKHVRK